MQSSFFHKNSPVQKSANFLQGLLLISILSCTIYANANTYTVTNTANSGAGSLRQAIIDANANAGPDNIVFNIPGTAPHAIILLSSLPTISDTVVIDGFTQPGNGYTGNAPKIELDGSSFSFGRGFDLYQVSDCEIYGIYIHGFSSGIYGVFADNLIIGSNIKKNVISGNSVSGIFLAGVNNLTIEGNFIGTDTSGIVVFSNGIGIYFQSNVNNSTIINNVISGNTDEGIQINSGNNIIIKGNKIGTDYTGNVNLGNSAAGVYIWAGDNVIIGGTNSGDGNLISGNSGWGGLWIAPGADSSIIIGNKIGTNISGTDTIPNTVGIVVQAYNVTIGGNTTAESNLISGNNTGIEVRAPAVTIIGNKIGTDITGTTSLGNNYGIYYWVTSSDTSYITSNLISGNQKGIYLYASLSTDNVVIQKNKIGTDISGAYSLGNNYGIDAWSPPYLTIGGNNPADGNLISGNSIYGIKISLNPTNKTVIRNNKIGVDINDTTYIPNSIGISILGGLYSDINNNKVAGNNSTGIQLLASADSTEISNNIIIDNGGRGIYTDSDGTLVLNNTITGNSNYGIQLNSAKGAIIYNNDISNNNNRGIYVDGSDSVTIDSNIVTWNSDDGIFVYNSDYSTIINNIITNNDTTGVQASYSNYSTIIDNTIMDNLSHGLELWLSRNWSITNNTIAQNGTHGINIIGDSASASIRNLISQNSIFNNLNKGIHLNYGTGDEANTGYLPPVITMSTPDSIKGTSEPLATIELYYNESPNSNPQGKTYIGSALADSTGDWKYIDSITSLCNVTALAIDTINNTSEFAVLSQPLYIGPDTSLLCADSIILDAGVNSSSYSWSTGDTTKTISVDTSGIYSVIVTDTYGCTANDSVTIIIPTALNLFTSYSDVSCSGVCDGFASTTALGGTPSYTYLWSDSLAQTTQIATGLCAGIYTITVLDSNGCIQNDTVIISEPSAIIIIIISADVTCSGDSNATVDLTVSGGTLPYSYNWSTGDTTEDLSGLPTGNYSVVVTDSNACQVTDSVTITEPPPIAISAIVDTATQGNSDGSIDITVIGGTPLYTYLWSNGATTEDIDSVPAGIYVVEVIDSFGCVDSLTVEVPEVTGIIEAKSQNEIMIFPNPTFGKITLQVNLSQNGDIRINVYNVLGELMYDQKLKSNKGSSNPQIDLSKLRGGIYMLQVELGETILRKKIIKL